MNKMSSCVAFYCCVGTYSSPPLSVICLASSLPYPCSLVGVVSHPSCFLLVGLYRDPSFSPASPAQSPCATTQFLLINSAIFLFIASVSVHTRTQSIREVAVSNFVHHVLGASDRRLDARYVARLFSIFSVALVAAEPFVVRRR